MCGQIEGDRHPLLSGREIAAIEGIRFLRRGEAGILPDRPGAAGIHRRLDPAGEGLEARQRAQMRQPRDILVGIERLHGYALQRLPGQVVERTAPQFLFCQVTPGVFLRWVFI